MEIKNLKYEKKNAWKQLDEKELTLLNDYSQGYKNFLNVAKTERLAAKEIIRLAKENGFKELQEYIKLNTLKAGDKVFYNNREKGVMLFVIGKKEIQDGMNIVGGHIDAPRLDIKPNPLYEDGDLAFLKTHYYGGIKKYQWTTIPLSMHGIIFKKNGEKVEISIGEKEEDPVFYITDLLIHLAKDQMDKKLAEGITGEGLNVVVGSMPLKGEEKESIKANVLKYLFEEYDIIEEDFLSAEIEIVPATKARDIGFDRALIGSYGHDDRVCSYAGLKGLFDADSNVERTMVGLFVDKEEIGSMGNTGMESRVFENVVAELINLQGNYCDLKVRRALANSRVLSADVTAGFDPNFAETMEKKNSAFIGSGVVVSKYTGSRGKAGCNDANSEFLAQVRKIFDDANVVWQTGELGKVDQGGGGTIAYILANYGAQVVDCGVAVISMHAPVEVISKADIYMTYKAYKAFYEAK